MKAWPILSLSVAATLGLASVNAAAQPNSAGSPIGSTPNQQGLYETSANSVRYNQHHYVSNSPIGSIPSVQGDFVYAPGNGCVKECNHSYIANSPIGSVPNKDGKHRVHP
ncbi:hypothetical protein [Vibrio sp. WXL210]|uniref:hypothetical protein n=1 Tax=Vibrio sp. WXL210 TaxID=3450709 RepID=UPI003EC8E69A